MCSIVNCKKKKKFLKIYLRELFTKNFFSDLILWNFLKYFIAVISLTFPIPLSWFLTKNINLKKFRQNCQKHIFSVQDHSKYYAKIKNIKIISSAILNELAGDIEPEMINWWKTDGIRYNTVRIMMMRAWKVILKWFGGEIHEKYRFRRLREKSRKIKVWHMIMIIKQWDQTIPLPFSSFHATWSLISALWTWFFILIFIL